MIWVRLGLATLVVAFVAGAFWWVDSLVEEKSRLEAANRSLTTENGGLHDRVQEMAEAAKQTRAVEAKIAALVRDRSGDAAAIERWLRDYSMAGRALPSGGPEPSDRGDCGQADPARTAEIERACAATDSELRILKDALRAQFPKAP